MNDVLVSLIANTPSASLKLSAAWDGLSAESQMEVLHAIGGRRGLPSDVATKAMASQNAFVRCLAAECVARERQIDFRKAGWATAPEWVITEGFRPAFDAALIDPDPLVRSVVEEGPPGFPNLSAETREAFWALSKPARFRYLRSCDGDQGGTDVVALIEHALAKKISGDQVEEVLVEYVGIVKASASWNRYTILGFADRAPARYAEFIRQELEVRTSKNNWLLAWVEPDEHPSDADRFHFQLKEPTGSVAYLARLVCLWGTFIGLVFGIVEGIRNRMFEPLPFLIALTLGLPPLLKSILITEIQKTSSFPMWGSATPRRFPWIRLAWQLSWLFIVVVGGGASAILIIVLGPGLVRAYQELDLRLLTSANLLLLLVLLWRTTRQRVADATVAGR